MFVVKSERAFTLLEIMIVVAIIGLLMMIALPNYNEARTSATSAVCCGNQKVIFSAVVMYNLNEANSLEDVDVDSRLQELVDKGYLRSGTWGSCPESSGSGYNDYTLTFEDGVAVDIECKVNPTNHRWP